MELAVVLAFVLTSLVTGAWFVRSVWTLSNPLVSVCTVMLPVIGAATAVTLRWFNDFPGATLLMVLAGALIVGGHAAGVSRYSPSWRGQVLDDLQVCAGVTAIVVILWQVFSSASPSHQAVIDTIAVVGYGTGGLLCLRHITNHYRSAAEQGHNPPAQSPTMVKIHRWSNFGIAATSLLWLSFAILNSFANIGWANYVALTAVALHGICSATFLIVHKPIRIPEITRFDPEPSPTKLPFIVGATTLITLLIAAGFLMNRNSGLILGLVAVTMAALLARHFSTIDEFRSISSKMKDTEQYYRELVQNSSDVLLLCDPEDLTATYVSPSADRVLGSHQDLQGQSLHRIIGSSRRVVGDVISKISADQPQARLDGKVQDRMVEAVANRHGDDLIVTVRDVTEREHLRTELHQLAFVDPLTGLANRHRIINRVEQMLRRDSTNVAVLFIDLDRFKQVNDAGGHEIGDRVLVEVADRLSAVIDPTTQLGRLGGDEFVAIVNRSQIDPMPVAHHLAEALQAPFNMEGRTYQLGGSVGVAIPDGPTTAGELLRQADIAMYSAKRRHLAAVLYDSGMKSAAIADVDRDAAVAQALRQRDFELYLQPLVDLATGKVCGVEALIRWIDSAGKVRGPGELIEFARRTGQMNVITDWTMERALFAAQSAQPHIGLSVNLPPEELLDPNFTQDLQRRIERYGIRPSRLTLEITEDHLIEEAQQATSVLDDLRSMGVKVVIDDFGTGFSSLSYLLGLPLSGIKMDREFIQALPHRKSARSIVRSLADLCRENTMSLVCEGIETLDEHILVNELAGTIGQGFYYGMPQAARECGDLADLAVWTGRTAPNVEAASKPGGLGSGRIPMQRTEELNAAEDAEKLAAQHKAAEASGARSAAAGQEQEPSDAAQESTA